MAIKYLDELKIRQVNSEGVPGIHQLKLRSGALDMVNIYSNIAVPTTFSKGIAIGEISESNSFEGFTADYNPQTKSLEIKFKGSS